MFIEYGEIENSRVEEYASLYQNVFAEEPWKETFDKNNIIKYFSFCCKNDLYGGIVAREKDLLYGIITYFLKPSAAGTILYIDELIVSKVYRKKGIGSKLIMEVEKMNSNIAAIIIHTDRDTEAYKLYKKLGYVDDNNLVALYKNI